MKKVIVCCFLFLMLFNQSIAQAFMNDPVYGFDSSGGIDFTGNYAEYYDSPSWMFTLGLGAVNVENHSYGFASRFTLDNPTPIQKIVFDMDVTNRYDNGMPVDFNFTLYQGDRFFNGNLQPVPNANNQIFKSDLVVLDFDIDGIKFDGSPHYKDIKEHKGVETQINKTLDSGTYWLAYEYDGGNPGVFKSAKVVTPEPSTMLLLGGGLMGILRSRRRLLDNI